MSIVREIAEGLLIGAMLVIAYLGLLTMLFLFSASSIILTVEALT